MSKYEKSSVFQWIDFYSSDSTGQIVWYFWDFWDWETSTDANPTHEYERPWTYKVKLVLEFINKNSLKDEMEMEIYRD